MRHARKVQPADQVIEPEGFLEAPDGADAVFRRADDETVAAERLQLVHRGAVLAADERMLPAAAILVAIVDHQKALGQLPGALARLRHDHLARERRGRLRRVLAGGG